MKASPLLAKFSAEITLCGSKALYGLTRKDAPHVSTPAADRDQPVLRIFSPLLPEVWTIPPPRYLVLLSILRETDVLSITISDESALRMQGQVSTGLQYLLAARCGAPLRRCVFFAWNSLESETGQLVDIVSRNLNRF